MAFMDHVKRTIGSEADESGHRKITHEFSKWRNLYEVADTLTTIAAGVLGVWVSIDLIIVMFNTVSWLQLPYLLLFWIAVSYLALPRFHQIMTWLYVPDYFIGRTRTGDGILGDPVNLAFNGSADEIHQIMRTAGWKQADEMNSSSVFRMIYRSLRSVSYPTAPVSDLYLFKRRHDFAYQMEVDGSTSKRHHIRFWHTPDGWLLPGGKRVEWIAAATYDKSVGISLFTLQITHKIEANTDIERNFVIKSIAGGDATEEILYLKDFFTSYHSRNGGGGEIQTDGTLPVISLKTVKNRPEVSHRKKGSLAKTPGAPAAMVISAIFTVLMSLTVLAQTAYLFANDRESDTLLIYVGIFLLVIFILAMLAKTLRGDRISCLVLNISLIVFALVTLVDIPGIQDGRFFEILLAMFGTLAALGSTSTTVEEWMPRRRAWEKARKAMSTKEKLSELNISELE